MKSLMLKVLICLGLSVPAYAEVYKWVDGEGKVHFGDKPPPKVEAQALDLPEASPASEARDISDQERAVRTRKLVKALEEERLEKEKIRAQKKKEAETLAANCNKLNAKIKHSERVTRYYRYDEKGDQEYIDDKTADAYRAKLKALYKTHCAS